MEIWCNESQERYTLAIKTEDVAAFAAICARERCPYAVVGTATAEKQLIVEDTLSGTNTVDMPMPVLLGKAPRMKRESRSASTRFDALETYTIALAAAAQRSLTPTAVSSRQP